MPRYFCPSAVVILVLSLRPILVAQEPVQGGKDAQSLSIDAALASAAARPAEPQLALAKARKRLAAALEQLEQLLSKSKPDERQQWLTFLGVSTIRDELAKPQVNAAALRDIQQRYFQNQSGLELPAMIAVRRSVSDLLTCAEYAQGPEPEDAYRQKLADVKAKLALLAENPTDEAAQQVGSLVAWLDPLSDEGSALAQAVRSRYCQPNGTGQVSQRFVNLMLAQTVAEQRFISDVILGTQTSGIAQTQAQVWFGTVPNEGRGTLEVRLEGRTDCPANVAQRRRVSVISASQTSIHASKHVHFSDLGLALTPATAACATSVQISDVEAGRRLVERLARRRASQLAPQAEAAASRRAEAEASSKLDQEADAALGRMNKFFCDKIRAPLIRTGALPAQLNFSTDNRHLHLVLAQYNSAQLGATTAGPQMSSDIDLGGTVHESLVNNFCETLLKGATIKDESWRELLNLLTGSSPRHLWVHDRAERWSATMAQERPVVVQFADQRLGITFRVERVTRGSTAHDGLVEIEARFIPQITADGPAFAREGELLIRIAGENTQEHDELRRFLTRKFGAVLPPELRLSGLVPPAGGALGKLRQLNLTQLTTAGGWLSIGYQLSSERIASLPVANRR
jgi:hypothetical protein